MSTPSTARAAFAALALLVVSTTPILAQSASDAGGGAQTSPNGSPADQQTAKRVYDQLTADQVDYYKHVTVTAENGVVTLGGSVDTTEALNRAKKIARGVQGVTKVVDQMKLERAPARSAGD